MNVKYFSDTDTLYIELHSAKTDEKRDLDRERWNEALEQDFCDGKLDFLVAQTAQADGTLQKL